MEEKANIIINKFTNALSNINPAEFISQIKNIKDSSQFLEISKKFCEVITNIKAQILFDISDEILSLVKKKDKSLIDNNNEIKNNNKLKLNNDIFKELKSLVSLFKLKISNILSNISELNSSLTIVSNHLKKKKYSLVSLKLEKLFKLKDNMDLNIKSLEKLEYKLSESLNSKNSISEYNYKNTNIKVKVIKLSKTPPHPFHMAREKMNFSTMQSNKKNYLTKKYLSSNKLINYKKNNSFKINEKKREKNLSNNKTNNSISRSKNKSSNQLKNYYNKENNKIYKLGDKKEKQKIDKKIIITQKEVIEKLKNEIENLKEKINIKKSTENDDNDSNIKIKLQNNVLLFLNEKLRIISYLIFSITFSINNLQNNNISIDEEYNKIKNNLINMTSEISEIKSNFLRMSLENENIFKKENEKEKEKDDINNNNLLNINKINIENEINLSFYKNKIKNLQKENENLNSSIEKLKSKISSLTQLITSEEKNTEAKLSNDNNNDDEILLLKEKVKHGEKKLIEMREIYEADINSKNIIEKLLRKNIDELKETYEQKILKLNKKLEEKGKEINEKNTIINKMNYKKIKSLNINEECKKLSSSTNNDDILKINDEISKVRFDKEIKNDLSLENSISLSLLKEYNEENEKKEKIKKLEDEISSLKLINNKINTELNELKNEIKQKDEILSLKEINSSFANEINSIKNVMSNNNIYKLEIEKRNSSTNQNDLLKSKAYSTESENELVIKLKNDINLLQINKRNLENLNKELNDKIIKKDKEIICLITNNNKEKKNINEQHKNEIEKLNKEIKDKTIKNEQFSNEIAILQKKLKQIENTYVNGGDLPKIKKKFENLEKKLNIILFIEGNMKWFNDEDGIEDEDEDEEEDDDETDEEFIEKIKKINKYRINDNYEMKIYKKENKKMIHRYEFTLDENNELKKKMITIEEIVINKQNELYNNLKKGFNALLNYLTINNKSKDKVIYFLNLIQFSEQEIKIIINAKK